MSERPTFLFSDTSAEFNLKAVAEKDVIVTHSGKRCVVSKVDENIHGPVFLCVNLDGGRECIVLAREVAYRSS